MTGKASSARRTSHSAVRVALTSLFIALGVALSFYPGSIPVGPTKVFPFQHMINALAGIILGPVNAAVIAFGITVLRIGLGTGTIFGYPGAIPGALIVGFAYHYLKKSDLTALTEPIGTGIGGLISAFFVAPIIGAKPLPSFIGLTAQWELFVIFFWMSSIPGAVIGYILVVALRRRGVLERVSV